MTCLASIEDDERLTSARDLVDGLPGVGSASVLLLIIYRPLIKSCFSANRSPRLSTGVSNLSRAP